jgi:hypothetical protein
MIRVWPYSTVSTTDVIAISAPIEITVAPQLNPALSSTSASGASDPSSSVNGSAPVAASATRM